MVGTSERLVLARSGTETHGPVTADVREEPNGLGVPDCQQGDTGEVERDDGPGSGQVLEGQGGQPVAGPEGPTLEGEEGRVLVDESTVHPATGGIEEAERGDPVEEGHGAHRVAPAPASVVPFRGRWPARTRQPRVSQMTRVAMSEVISALS